MPIDMTSPAAGAVIDLRSDLLSRPSPAMVEAAACAMKRPAAFGLREDEDQRALERTAAELLGTEDALFMPTCSMANEVALLALARPGERVLAQPEVHASTSEAGAPAALAGLQIVDASVALPPAACPPLEAWRSASQPLDDPLKSPVSVFLLENTHNRAGGLPWPSSYGAAVTALARERGIATHLDGARLPNAAQALATTMGALAAGFDTVSLSLNKGLGAPLGAVLAGSGPTIRRALALRQRLGGGWRPTALVAAPARVALEEGWAHIADDHRRARLLADALRSLAGLRVAAEATTNIVIADLSDEIAADADAVLAELSREGVLGLPFGMRRLRFVTYRGVTDDDIEGAVAALGRVLSRLPKTRSSVSR